MTGLTSPATFALDTGVELASVEAAYPGVIEAYRNQGTSLGLVVACLGLVGLVLAWMGLITGERSAWVGSATVCGATMAVAISILAAGGRLDVAAVWIAYAVLLMVGLVLTAWKDRRA